jgi:hypothetical protein
MTGFNSYYQKSRAFSLLNNTDGYSYPDSLPMRRQFEIVHEACEVQEEARILERLLTDQRTVIEAFKRKIQGLEIDNSKQLHFILAKTLRRLNNYDRTFREIQADAKNVTNLVKPIISFLSPLVLTLK